MQDDLFFGPDFFLEDQDEPRISLREGELREVAVLFADIKGFTNISNLFEPEVIHGKMDEIMKIFSRCISFYGGFVDKYMGDGIMALFGAKKASEQDTQRAILAAIKMQDQLRIYNKLLARQPGFEQVELGLRIGINTGIVSVGKVGESREGDFTVYGPQVNLASRMESNAPVNRIMMPRSTMDLVKNIFEFESQGQVNVKGMDEPIDCWLVIGQKNEVQNAHQRVFIGREAELDILEQEFEHAQKHTRVVGIKGDAGIGKSSLLQEFCLHKVNALILQGFCSSISPAPFNLFTRMLENYFHINHTDEPAKKQEMLEKGLKALAGNADEHASLMDTMPLIAFLMEVRIPDPRTEQKGKDLLSHILKAVETLLHAILEQAHKNGKEIILILDDVHLIDEASTQVLEFLLDKLQQNSIPIIIIALYRLDYEIVESITRHPGFREVELNPFDRETIFELLRLYAGDKKLNEETMNMVIELSAGNPFYLEEWCNYIGNLPKTELDEYPVPGNLHSLILSRLDNLPQNLRLLLHKAAVIGNEFFVEILREVEKRLQDPINIEITLGRLEEHSLIMKLLGFDFSSYFFKHITTREVAYQTLLHQNRKMLHQLTAEAIEVLFSDRLDDFVFVLQDHYVKADLPKKAIPYLQKALEKAAKAYDNSRALKLGERLLAYTYEPEKKAEILINLADILWLTGKWNEAANRVKEARLLIKPESALMCSIYRFEGVVAFYTGDFENALRLFDAGYQLALSLEDSYQLCIAQNNLGIWYQHHAKYDEAMAYHEQSLKLAEESKDFQRMAKTYSNLGLIYLEQSDAEKAYSAFAKSLKLSRENRFMRDESIALGNLGWACLHLERWDEAEELLQKKLDLATQMNDKLEIIQALGNLGNLFYEQEDFAKALEYYERSLALKEVLGNLQEIERSKKAIEICRAKLQDQKETNA